jgi:hypothetical protein
MLVNVPVFWFNMEEAGHVELLLGMSSYYGPLLQRDDALSIVVVDVLQFSTSNQISVTTLLARFPDFKPSNQLLKENKKQNA